tara:strand:+ start:1539 stop:2072 length:534 start_codon:yes stop_codon:yes gene_type:complete
MELIPEGLDTYILKFLSISNLLVIYENDKYKLHIRNIIQELNKCYKDIEIFQSRFSKYCYCDCDEIENLQWNKDDINFKILINCNVIEKINTKYLNERDNIISYECGLDSNGLIICIPSLVGEITYEGEIMSTQLNRKTNKYKFEMYIKHGNSKKIITNRYLCMINEMKKILENKIL